MQGSNQQAAASLTSGGSSSSSNDDKLSDGQPTLKQFVKANQSLDKNFDQHTKINQSIAKKIFSDLQPFSVVEDTGFWLLVKTLEPMYVCDSLQSFIQETYYSISLHLVKFATYYLLAILFVR